MFNHTVGDPVYLWLSLRSSHLCKRKGRILITRGGQVPVGFFALPFMSVLETTAFILIHNTPV